MLFYLITFILGFALDYAKQEKKIVITCRKIFVVWLFVFLCFGYMTGSDWRTYELDYEYIDKGPFFFSREIGFYYLFRFFRLLISDYWITIGILKCLYLYTLLRVIKKLTPYWLSVVSLMLTGSLIFILIDNPVRYMVALTLVNIALEFALDKKYKMTGGLVFAAFFFHNTCFFFFIIIPVIMYAEKIATINKLALSIVYIGVVVISTQVSIMENIRSSIIDQIMTYSNALKDYSSYTVESNKTFFSIGSILNILFFFLVVLSSDKIVDRYENGKFVYGLAIVQMFFSRLLIMIPTGFRLNVPFAIFYMLYIVYLMRSKHMFRWIFILYFCVSFPRTLWNAYVYIPYSNSIPYILTEHKSYSERSTYNLNAYTERTGKSVFDE